MLLAVGKVVHTPICPAPPVDCAITAEARNIIRRAMIHFEDCTRSPEMQEEEGEDKRAIGDSLY
jgi:hypothetical protein